MKKHGMKSAKGKVFPTLEKSSHISYLFWAVMILGFVLSDLKAHARLRGQAEIALKQVVKAGIVQSEGQIQKISGGAMICAM